MKFEEINIGQKAAIRHRISQDDIQAFVKITGDDNRLHVSEKYAAGTSFKKPVAHGMLSAAFISTVIGTKIPGDGALWYEQHLEFLLPVRVGDEITIQAEVIKKIDRLRAIELKTDVYNQHKQKVIAGTAKVKIVEEESTAEDDQSDNNQPLSALIIGATGGIGSAVAGMLAERGYNLMLHFHKNGTKAMELKNRLERDFQVKVFICQADVNNKEEVEEMFGQVRDRLHGVNCLVHAATGPVNNVGFDMLEWQDYQSQLNVHVKGFFHVIKAFVKQTGRYGKIVGISSQTTDYPFSDLSPYTTAKAAMEGFVRSLAVDLARSGIRLNMVSPGITETDLNADLPEKAKLLAAAKTPLKRLAKPHDVAEAICFLLSSGSDYLTGETIRINGGVIMK